MSEAIGLVQARRLALVCAGLFRPRWTGLPSRARGRDGRARRAALAIIRHFGYLQLDTVSIAGVRSHSLVLLARLQGLDAGLAEELLRPGQPLFEYWGHEASWMPMELYPYFEFRRRRFRTHPWWGDLLTEHPAIARQILLRVEREGALRSADLDGQRAPGMWNLKLAKRVADALWSCGDLAIRERRNFQLHYDLPSRVIPEHFLRQKVPLMPSLQRLLLQALRGHGWASTGTLSSTWRLRNMASEVKQALQLLEEEGSILACSLVGCGRQIRGWIRPRDLERAERLRRIRPPDDRALLLSPFDPLLWDRQRVRLLFDFHQVLEIYKPASQRLYGYYCLPFLVGERLVARCDLKARHRQGRLDILSLHVEEGVRAPQLQVVRSALESYAATLRLAVPKDQLAAVVSAP